MQLEIWSDIVCPWCYIGKRRLERALADLPERDAIEVRFRSFELDPGRASSTVESLEQMLSTKYGVSTEQARAMNERVTRLAAEEGIGFRLDIARPGNTFDAHRLAHLAHAQGLGATLMERLQAAYFCEGAPIGDRATLRGLATDVGMDEGMADVVLGSDGYADDVRADEALAAQLGIRGVPFFVFDRRLGVSGAQDPTVLAAAYRQARTDAAAEPAPTA